MSIAVLRQGKDVGLPLSLSVQKKDSKWKKNLNVQILDPFIWKSCRDKLAMMKTKKEDISIS